MSWRGVGRVVVSSFGALALGTAAVAACDGVGVTDAPSDASDDVPFIDARGPAKLPVVEIEDAGPTRTADAAAVAPIDSSPPGAITDIAAVADTHESVTLTWIAPPDEADAGTVAAYEIRYAPKAMATLADFVAGAVVVPPTPLAAGSTQTIVVSGLTPATEYHFAVRARDAAGNFGPPSPDAVVTTKARAMLLVSEVAPNNSAAQGNDFVELVAITAGSTAGLELRHSSGAMASALLHRFAPLDVGPGDRIVVHVAGLPAAPGALQEDVAKTKSASTEAFASEGAYDVYSPVATLVASNSVIAVLDGTAYQDAVAYSDRSAVDASPTVMGAFAAAHSAGAWTFGAAPVDRADDCAALLDVANANASASVPACGGYPGFLAPGSSLQRRGVVDTNTRADFFVAPQTRGTESASYCPPEGAKLALMEVSPTANLVELVVTKPGSLRGFTVRRDPRTAAPLGTLLGTLPAICGSVGDVVVLHLDAPEGTPSETAAKDELLASSHPGNYDGAWDTAQSSSASSLPYATSLVIAVRSVVGTYVDGAAFSSHTVTAPDGGTFHQSLAYLQGLGLWLPADCGGAPCTNATMPSARDVAASWNGTGPLAIDPSTRRSSPTSPRDAQGWSVGTSSFGQ